MSPAKLRLREQGKWLKNDVASLPAIGALNLPSKAFNLGSRIFWYPIFYRYRGCRRCRLCLLPSSRTFEPHGSGGQRNEKSFPSSSESKNPKMVVLPSMTCDLVVSIRILEALSCAICQAFGDCEAKGSKGLKNAQFPSEPQAPMAHWQSARPSATCWHVCPKPWHRQSPQCEKHGETTSVVWATLKLACVKTRYIYAPRGNLMGKWLTIKFWGTLFSDTPKWKGTEIGEKTPLCIISMICADESFSLLSSAEKSPQAIAAESKGVKPKSIETPKLATWYS